MTERKRARASEKPASPEKIDKLEFIGKKKQSLGNSVDITRLVRSLQRAEGSLDCFRRAGASCDRLDCAWYRYCVEEGRVTLGKAAIMRRT